MKNTGKRNLRYIVIRLLAIAIGLSPFLFFEIALQKTLPKGFTDPWFEPIFEVFY